MTYAGLLMDPGAASERDKLFGVMIGVVTNNKDPDKMGRVKVRFPWLNDDDESHWARIVTPMAGNDRGLYMLPEVDDEVLVAFEHGRIEFPYVLGALWNGKDATPENNSDGKNNMRTIKSRSGHILRFDDSSGAEKIEVIDKTGNNKLVIDASANTIKISAQSDIELESKTGKVKITGIGVEITSNAGVKIDAMANVDVSANALVNIKGSLVKLN